MMESNSKPADQSARIQQLEERIRVLETENRILRSKCGLTEPENAGPKLLEEVHSNGLTASQIQRYSRQLLMSNGFGVEGQLKLLQSSVLIVGAGGIGSTVILYLASSGVGKMTIVDFDEIDVSNLHRQVIHKSCDVGMNKAESACRAAKALNPSIECNIVKMPFMTSNALDLVSEHDCVIDASDNPQTRYIINDACVIGGKPLVSGSAMGSEGQLTVYNYKDGPCYRCLYPKPSASEGCKTCADNGVLGPVPGIIGIFQAMETLKIITGFGKVMHDRLAMFDSIQCSLLRIKKPPKQAKCPVCGPDATIKSMRDSETATASSRGPSCTTTITTPIMPESLSISCKEYNEMRKKEEPHVLLDVRVKEQFDLCSLKDSTNLPLEKLQNNLSLVEELSGGTKPVYCLCRRGIASASATTLLNTARKNSSKIHSVKNITGGLDSWRREVDKSFPSY
eukprot:scaffold6278_cov105-Cylindrotheca_fusiformis.AAC.3